MMFEFYQYQQENCLNFCVNTKKDKKKIIKYKKPQQTYTKNHHKTSLFILKMF